MKQIAGKKQSGHTKNAYFLFSNWPSDDFNSIYIDSPTWYRLDFIEAKLMDVLGYLGPCKRTDPPGNWDAYLFVCKLYSLKGEKQLLGWTVGLLKLLYSINGYNMHYKYGISMV